MGRFQGNSRKTLSHITTEMPYIYITETIVQYVPWSANSEMTDIIMEG